MTINAILVEGLDRLGKSTLVESIQQELGYFQVIHFGKPQKLKYYEKITTSLEGIRPDESAEINPLFQYQFASFKNMFELLRSDARIISDRAHLGECVYSPIYRNYSGDYVYDLERKYGMGDNWDARLILLTEDFATAKHFVDDGLSFDVTKREQEQNLFLEAFEKSIIRDKRIVCVTDPAHGGFKPKEWILEEVLA